MSVHARYILLCQSIVHYVNQSSQNVYKVFVLAVSQVVKRLVVPSFLSLLFVPGLLVTICIKGPVRYLANFSEAYPFVGLLFIPEREESSGYTEEPVRA